MKILVLGGTGNLSSDSAELMLKRGNEVTLVTRGHNPVPQGFGSIVADRYEPGALKNAIGDRTFDVVADFTTYNPDQGKLAWEALSGRCGQYIFVSTICVYSKPAPKLPITENDPQGNEFSEYGRLKEQCEVFFRGAATDKNLPLTIVRPAHTYSHRWIPNPVTSAGYTLAWRLEHKLPVFIHDDGQSLWTLTHTRDFAVGFAGLVGNQAAFGEAFQITSDMVLTWNQIMAEIVNAVGVKEADIRHIPTDVICRIEPMMTAKLKGDKANHGIFDCAKLKRIVPDFQCCIPFRDGIRESIAWFREVPARMVPDPKINAIYDHILAKA